MLSYKLTSYIKITFYINVRAFDLKSWELEKNFAKSEANLFKDLKIFCRNQKMQHIENVHLR